MGINEILERKEPIIYLVTSEESRAEAEIQKYCEASTPPMSFFRWSNTRGMEKMQGGIVESVEISDEPGKRMAGHSPLVPVLEYIVHKSKEDGIYLLKDIHQFLRGGITNFNPTIALTIRALRDSFYELRSLRKMRKIILLCPEMIVPTDLEKELRIYDFPLPMKEELADTVQSVLRRAQAIHQKDPLFMYQVKDPKSLGSALVNAAVGLTQVEVEYILENMLYVDRMLGEDAPLRMIREKQQIIHKSGVLEYIPIEDLQELEVGGLEAMLRWLKLRQYVFNNFEKALKDYYMKQMPRGVLLVGIPGCGKSLVCKKIAQEWGIPLLRLDLGAIFDRFVGASEERIRKALRVAESVAPCILWIDEIEKGFSSSLGGDGGTSARVLATFLVWMQEKNSPVFIAATANNITTLPPEMLRSGRFDNRFFVGCPGDNSRRDIFKIHLQARNLDPQLFDLEQLVAETFGHSGAEIEQIVIDSTYDAFYENRRTSMDDLLKNTKRTQPLVRSLGPQMEKILQLLDQGRIELASDDTIKLNKLIEKFDIKFK